MDANELSLENLPRTVELCREAGRITFSFIDQRQLPSELQRVGTSDWREVADAISQLAVRGAPAIGISGAAALCLWVAARDSADWDPAQVRVAARVTAESIASVRPTAVNLKWAVDRALDWLDSALAGTPSQEEVVDGFYGFVKGLEADDEAANRALAGYGAALLKPDSKILTHCNAGSLGTAFYGTALGIVYTAAEQGKVERVYADETRPVGQGARLTTWELSRAGVPVTLICDNMAASLMASGEIDAVIVGADRIAANGDVANKIGTYGVAVLAHHHGIPFYVAAPTSTIDLQTEDGSKIVIEQRAAEEVLPAPISGVDVWNPAFDVTPANLVAKIITERGAFAPDELALRL